MNKYFAVASISIAALILIIGILFTYSVSNIRIIDPIDEQSPIPAHHDIVVVHKGCGDKSLAGTFSAILDKGAANQRDISAEFTYSVYEPSRDHIQEKWVADEFEWPTGQHSLTVSADVSGNIGCFFVFNEHEIKLPITEFLEPRHYKGLLHDKEDKDRYFFKAKKTGFGSWFHFSAKAENPAELRLRFRIIGPAGGNIQEQKQAESNLWVALADDVMASVEVSQDHWSPGSVKQGYTLDVLSQEIPDKHEPNDSERQAKLFPKTKSSYLVSVLNGNDQAEGLADYFFFGLTTCEKGCVQVWAPGQDPDKLEPVESPYYLNYRAPSGACHNGFTGLNKVCACNDLTARPGVRFISIECKSHIDCKPYGTGDVPDRYFLPYHLRYEKECEIDWVNSHCDWDNRPESCK